VYEFMNVTPSRKPIKLTGKASQQKFQCLLLYKVCGCYLITFLNWTPMFDWYG
jgi:hypothetical protein